MAKIVKIVKISSEGQITLPEEVREKLKSDTLCIVITDDGIRLEPVRDVDGRLKQYTTRTVSTDETRDHTWTEAPDDLYGAFKNDSDWGALFDEIERSRNSG